ncbi:hypothetical protein KCU71_g11361, partial [Aureobasidium melanogenum]
MSDSGDVSMSDAEPEPTGPPSISIPDPPKLPALFEDDQGVVHRTVWHQHARHFVARYNKDFTGFDVRQESGADSRGDQNGGTGDEEEDEDPQTLSDYSQRETHEKIVAMRNWTSWRIVNASYLVDRGAIADTGTKLDDNGKPVPASGP